MVKAIFRANNPVQIAGKLLDGEGDATAGKLFLQLLEYLYGKPDQQFEAGGPGEGRIVYQFVTTAPRPQYPTSSTSGAVAGAASNSAAILAPRSNGPETTQEDKHE